jgi:hypothetical protein
MRGIDYFSDIYIYIVEFGIGGSFRCNYHIFQGFELINVLDTKSLPHLLLHDSIV